MTARRSGSILRAAVEHTEYNVDRERDNRSAGRLLNAFWDTARRAIEERRKSGSIPAWIDGHIFLKGKQHFPKARDIDRFVDQIAVVTRLHADIERVADVREYPDDCVLLRRYVKRIRMKRLRAGVSMQWSCYPANTAWLGVRDAEVLRIIEAKARKAAQYRWPHGRLRYLLIAASGTTIYNSAGPYRGELDGVGLHLCESETPFDRVVFWDRVYDWHKQLYPEADVVKKESSP
ncbi:MAG: hypothetical protein O2901_11565 [Verrucomicrobia bacterium]|nr:hypothetical protein [Verrucomicrobiota bacterium]